MNNDLDSCVYIHGLGISSYRSFPKDIQKIYPFKKINLFIGRNNSGKSNILNFLYKHYFSIFRGEDMKFEDVDYHNFALFQKNEIQVEFYIHTTQNWSSHLLSEYRSVVEGTGHQRQYDNRPIEILRKILESKLLTENNDFWLVNKAIDSNSIFYFADDIEQSIYSEISQDIGSYLETIYLKLSELEELTSTRTSFLKDSDTQIDSSRSYSSYSALENLYASAEKPPSPKEQISFFKKILGCICDYMVIYSSYLDEDNYKISLIPAIREVGNPGTTFNENEFNGQGLIDGLAQLQHPDHFEQEKKEQFEKINQFLRTVTDNESAKIEIPHDKSKILVEMDGKTRPLQSLGTGIHEVIILAAAATIKENQVICMEEPELHLHPLLQKKLISYLQEKTNNQYFITTHSAHFLDTPDVSIFHVNYENGCSIVNRVETDNYKTTVLSDLGYKPSDLLQTNCVIWVEGPSDRIYLNYWIQCFAPELKEKIHYTIMFYGGGLLSHLSVSGSEDEDNLEQDLTDFISLLNINRNTVVMCDSDKKSKNGSLKKAVQRIKSEFEKGEFQGFHWITDGREVENYLDPDIVEKIIKQNHRNVEKINGKTIYDQVWKYESSEPKEDPTADKDPNANKVKLARGIVESEFYSPPSEDKFKEITNLELENSLTDWIKRLISFINKSNGVKVNEK
jgi:AAA15 family ATPase/GTPase